MPKEQQSEVRLEIGHVLFIDIVGYSKLLINEQSEQMQKLREIGSCLQWRQGSWKHPRESPYEDSRLSRRPYYAERSRYRS